MINTEKQKTLVIGHRNPDTHSVPLCHLLRQSEAEADREGL